jgi:hypothetical protein
MGDRIIDADRKPTRTRKINSVVDSSCLITTTPAHPSTPTSTVFSGGIVFETTRVTTTYTILASDYIIFGNTDSAGFTITLPEGVEGQTYKMINSGSSANNLTIAPDGAEHLIGANSNFVLFDGEALKVTYNKDDGWY